MAQYDFLSQRLFLPADLAAGGRVMLNREQTHYLKNVMRGKTGSEVLVFNGRDGEWRARLGDLAAKTVEITVERQERPQPAPGRIHYAFAPLKSARLDYVVQKAVEMGVARLQPMFTRRTVASRLNRERALANIIEAAEQCGILSVPELAEEQDFLAHLRSLSADAPIIFCDEDSETCDPLQSLRSFAAKVGDDSPLCVLIGPEGGFDEAERKALLARPGTLRLSLGPRILRADTAAVAALALVQAVLGDWASAPR